MAAADNNDAPRIKLEAWMVTDVGVVRPHNEDNAHVDSAGSFFIVADGMGGHAAGEVASEMAVATVRERLEAARPQLAKFAAAPNDPGRRALVQLLQDAVLSAHQAVFQRGSTEEDKNGMGTTLDVLLVSGAEAFIAHVGDSRTYLIREGRASQLTTDHTYAEVMVIEGKLTIEEAQVSQLRNILVNAIGVSAEVGVEMAHLELRRDDRLLLCSDGLHDYFPGDTEIAERLGEDTGVGLTSLVELAKTRGGHDNITGIAIQVLDVAYPTVTEHGETEPVPREGRGADEENTETTVLSDLAASGDDDGEEEPSSEAGAGEAEGGEEAAPTGEAPAPRKKRRSKRSSGRSSGRANRKSKPTRDALVVVEGASTKSAEEPALADTLPPSLIVVPPPEGAEDTAKKGDPRSGSES
ncbi:MAG: protein phosphatase 2C domain-containing protein [Kofleriaceae bacterium]